MDNRPSAGMVTLRRELTSHLGLDVPPRRTRRSSSVIIAELRRTLTARSKCQAPWNATNWRPPQQDGQNETDRRVDIAREALERYDAYNRAPRRIAFQTEQEDTHCDEEVLARSQAILLSTVAADVVDSKLATITTARQTRARERYEQWDSKLFRPLQEDLADAVDDVARERLAARGAAGGRGGVGGRSKSASALGSRGTRRGSAGLHVHHQHRDANDPANDGDEGGPRHIMLQPTVPLTLRDPMKRVLLKDVEEAALTQPINSASLALRRAQARELLPATFWSRQALSSTPHGYHLSARRPTASAASAQCRGRVYHDDFSRLADLAAGPNGRIADFDAEFPRGKAIAAGVRYADTRPTVQLQAALVEAGAAVAATDAAPRRPRPVGGRDSVVIE